MSRRLRGKLPAVHCRPAPKIQHSMDNPALKDVGDSGGGRRYQIPPPPASWPAAAAVKRGDSRHPQGQGQIASKVPSWLGFDEDFEVHLPGRRDTSFFVHVAGRELAATNGVAVVIHGVRNMTNIHSAFP